MGFLMCVTCVSFASISPFCLLSSFPHPIFVSSVSFSLMLHCFSFYPLLSCPKLHLSSYFPLDFCVPHLIPWLICNFIFLSLISTPFPQTNSVIISPFFLKKKKKWHFLTRIITFCLLIFSFYRNAGRFFFFFLQLDISSVGNAHDF